MDSAKQQLTDKLKTSNNILVTVSRNPSVDQLASCIGLALVLNKQGKHAAAVFSGQVPSTLEFLKPEDTLEKNTDSLRDFIIALDKSKADKLRYKVEDNVVRIFITPYRTSLSQDDLDFSEGDFNVDVVVALGVKQQEDLDEAITAHGRILHDATVASINTAPDGGLGTINWHDPQASSLSELVTDLTTALGDNILDSQIANALLTGIVSETDRFSNDKTSSQTMRASATLMAAGANQQLVASKLEESVSADLSGQGQPGDASQDQPGDESPKTDDGVIEIKHDDQTPDAGDTSDENTGSSPLNGTENNAPAPEPPSYPIDDSANTPATPSGSPETETPKNLSQDAQPPAGSGSLASGGSKLVTEPPSLGGVLTANSSQPVLDPVTDPMSLPNSEPPQLLDRKPDNKPAFGASQTPGAPSASAPQFSPPPPATPMTQPPEPSLPTSSPPAWTPPPPSTVSNPSSAPVPTQPAADDKPTLAQLEQSVQSPHGDTEDLDAVRDEVNRALNNGTPGADLAEPPIQALNSQPLGGDLHPSDNVLPPPPANPDAVQAPPATPQNADSKDSSAPPPVPPPIPFQFGNPSQQ